MSNYRRRYIKGGTYFFTVVLQERNQDLLVRYIELFREAYAYIQKKYPFKTIAIVVLPDHFHCIWQLPENDCNYSRRISCLKRYFSQRLPKEYYCQNESKLKKRELGIWQRRFWEHTIETERDLNNHIDYIHYNPVKHGYVENIEDWQYSSYFHFYK